MQRSSASCILVVDDEPLIAELLQAALEERGLTVATALSGEEAVSALRTHPFAALITDVDLGSPRDGWYVAREARNLFPGLVVIYMSGGSASEWSSNGVSGSAFLPKPFAPSLAAETLAGLIATDGGSARA